ncbi:MAG: fimbrillin family protein [Bacteroides sp.]|nr:fimbrillin family protein [Bacteroides sp.]
MKIIAYQPHNSNASIAGDAAGYDFTVETDQSGNSSKNYYNSDLLYSGSATYARKSAAHSLGFKHLLSKVVCKLEQGTGSPVLTDAIVSICNAELKGTFNPKDGNFTTKTSTSGQQSDVKMNSAITSGEYIAIIPPQTFATEVKFLEVKLKSGGNCITRYLRTQS